MRPASLVPLLFLAGCYLAHESTDAGPVDAHPFPPDTGPPPRDFGPDLPRPDLGVLVPCREPRDCATHPGTVCRRDPTAPPDDLAELPLVCAPPNGGAGVPGAVCDDTDDTSCETGLCVVGGTCVEPCVPDAADVITDRCDLVWVRTSATSMQHVVARTLRVLPVDGLTIADLGNVRVPAGLETPLALELGHATDVVVFDGPEGVVFPTHFEATTTGMTLFDVSLLGPTFPAPEGPISSTQSLPTIEVPNSPHELRDPRDRYTVLLSSIESATMHVIGLSREAPRSVLDLDIFLAGATDTPFNPIADVATAAIEQMRGMYLAAGIRLGEIRIHRLVGGLRSRWAVLPDIVTTMDIRIDGLFTLSAGVPTASISYFFVRDAGTVLGLAGGIPGPSPVTGSPGSGIVIAADAIGDTPEVPLWSVLAHETGHYLGLFHTTEVDGTVVEPLADTPECRPIHDTNLDGFLVPSECVGFGGDNVMFWGSLGDPVGFTADQRSVITRSPALH